MGEYYEMTKPKTRSIMQRLYDDFMEEYREAERIYEIGNDI